MLKNGGPNSPMPETPTLATAQEDDAQPVVTAKYPNHVWHVDLTAVPIVGFWVPWLPFALPQVWPFCWWIAVIIDHFSRRVIGAAVFKRPPTSQQVTAFLRRTIRKAHATPKYLICDQGPQFWCDGFKAWCKGHGIRIRFGAVGQHGSIAVVERFIRSLKEEGLSQVLISIFQRTFQQQVKSYTAWYNTHRPHTFLNGATPDERYFGHPPANRAPRFELRAKWPRGSPCAKPQALVKGQPGARRELVVTFEHGQRHLPVVELRRVA
jgi:transposase InsO family protein